jgi:mannose-6-phosphate isomerase-like protein (cupin superfamily)
LPHTVVNLKDVENSAEKFGLAPDLEARFASGALGLEKSGISYQRLAPGKRHPFGHRHKEQEEVYVVLSGGGRVKVDDEISEVKALDAIRVPPDAARAFEAGPDGIELIAFGAPRSGESAAADVEQLPDWWD